jgi:hypothetical protein
LRVGQAVYRAVLVSGLTTMRSSTLSLLREFAAAGGTVIVAGNLPTHVDALPSAEPERMLSGLVSRVEFSHEAVAAAAQVAVPPRVQFVDPATGECVSEIFCQARQAEDGDLIVVALNTNREHGFEGVRVRISSDRGQVQQWDCLTGARHRVPARVSDGVISFSASFAAGAERVYVVSRDPATDLSVLPRFRTVSSDAVSGPFPFSLSEANVCVLDFAEHRVDDGDWQPAREILKVDRAVRDGFGLAHRGGQMLQPWFVRKKGYERLGRVEVRFGFQIEELPAGPVELVVERPEDREIRVNGVTISPATDQGWWVDKVFRRLPVPSTALHTGVNTVVLSCDYHEASDLEAVYLLGQFGVRLNSTRAVLTRLPATLAVGDLAAQGLPFYSGAVAYRLPAPEAPSNGQRLFLCLPEFTGACAKVSTPGLPPLFVGWPPYEVDISELASAGTEITVELVLTRRNTFGPLHQVPLIAPGYGPDNFLTGGPGWSDEYMLIANGLHTAPVLEIREADA